jgi:2-polyprenyl-3-methyl-5-hydroxy-6-metoxy-1,4-benzoquinol methylase
VDVVRLKLMLSKDYRDYENLPGGKKKLEFIGQALAEYARAGSPGNIHVLDLGYGNGNIAFTVAAQGYQVLGVDIDPASIEYASSRPGLPNLQFLLVSEDLKELEQTFDVIICSEVLEHLPHPSRLVEIMKRLLSPQGMILVTIPNGYGPREVLGRLEKALRTKLKMERVLNGIQKLLRIIPSETKRLMYTSNPYQDHIQKFTLRSITRLFAFYGFMVRKKMNSFFLFSIFGKFGGRQETRLEHYDCKIADYLPSFLASGWYLTCMPQEYSPQHSGKRAKVALFLFGNHIGR